MRQLKLKGTDITALFLSVLLCVVIGVLGHYGF